MSDLSTAWIVAIVLGSVLVFVVITVLCLWIFVWRKRTVQPMEPREKEMQKAKYSHDKWDDLLKSIEKHQQKEVRSEVM